MKEVKEKQTVMIFPANRNDTLKRYAELVWLLDNITDNFNRIMEKIEEFNISIKQVDYCEENNELVKIIEKSENEQNYVLNPVQSVDELILYFRAYEDGENFELFAEEILCPFALLRRRCKYECILVIIPQKEGKIEYKEVQIIQNRISRYMYYESLCEQKKWLLKDGQLDFKDFLLSKAENKYYNGILLYANGTPQRLIRKFQRNTMANVMPLITLNANTYSILSQSIVESFGEEKDFKKCCLQNDFLAELQEKLFCGCSDEKIYEIEDKDEYEKALFEVIIHSICNASLKDMYLSGEGENSMIYDTCSHMSLLAFMLFAAIVKKIFKISELFENKGVILKLINLAQDYADGILQIIENVREYADIGYMKFRIIEVADNKNSLLKKQYPAYFKCDQINQEKFFLQIQIVDMSKRDIVSSFIAGNGNCAEKMMDNLRLKDFFQPINSKNDNGLWEYYSDIKNVAYHYGLRQFLSVVNNVKGYFEVISSQKFCLKNDDNELYSNFEEKGFMRTHLPGTEYRILLPIRYMEDMQQQPVGFGAEIDYKDIAIKQKWKCKLLDYEKIVEKNKLMQELSRCQEEKIEKINYLAQYIGQEKIERNILCFDAKNINQTWEIEIFAKALILHIVNNGDCQRIAVYNASRTFMVNFTRFICNFYHNIIGAVEVDIKDVQIYVCKDDYNVDIGFKGSDLEMAYKVCDYLARTKGIFNDSLELIKNMLDNPQNSSNSIKFAPFDLLINIDEGCLFEKRVKSDLEKDIQEMAFGCCLNDAHMRVGSKMHITDRFYDATLLFASGYYTSHFAYILAHKMVSLKLKTKKITLVGYENHSELLLTEMQRLLKENYKFNDVDYIIFEQGRRNGFKFLERERETYEDRKFVIVVPINSTLTTFSKIRAEIHNFVSDNVDIILNLGVILIRSSEGKIDKEKGIRGIETRYWENIDTNKRIVYTKMTNPKEVYYNVLLTSRWENPLICEACFPKKRAEQEIPMLTMSHTSVIPMILVGLNKGHMIKAVNRNDKMEQAITQLDSYMGEIRMLKDCLVYDHVENGSNHFEYYFETELLMKNIYENNKEQFFHWLRELGNIIELQNNQIRENAEYGKYIYDILVAPMNRTNASFVEYINMVAFKSVPIIVYVDANREFRDNIRAKYSNLTTLYNNLKSSEKNAVINFHFIDDSIISGTTFYRTKSLLKSLFPNEAFSEQNNVYVNIFQNVIILLNRCSKSTQLNYAFARHFFSYVDVHISSMRTHHNKACVLCENVNNYKMLRDYSSTNAMAMEWNRKWVKHNVKSIENAKKVYINDNNSEIRDRHFRRLFCANEFAGRLEQLHEKRNDKEQVKKLIYDLIGEKLKSLEDKDYIDNHKLIKSQLEWIISYLKVISRPFLIFRKSTLEAVFYILIKIMENWNSGLEEEDDIILDVIHQSLKIIEEGKCTFEFRQCVKNLYRCIIALLSALGSKYLIRKNNYNKIIANNERIELNEQHRNTINHTIPFILFYAANIKRMILLNKDETIGLWFEYLLVYGHEYSGETELLEKPIDIDEVFVKNYGIESDFGCMLFLENTYIIFQTVISIYEKCLKQCKDEKIRSKENIIENIEDFHDAYYYDNYRKLLALGLKEISKEDVKKEIIQMVLLYAKLKESSGSERNIEQYYKKLAIQIQDVAGANGIRLYGYSYFEGKDDYYQIALNGSNIQNQEMSDGEIIKSVERDAKKENAGILEKQKVLDINREEKYVLIRIDSNEETKGKKVNDLEKDNYRDNVYCFLFYDNLANVDKYTILRHIRNVLVFRHSMVERFEKDFHNNAFKVFTEQKHKNELLASYKAASHTSSETLAYVVTEVRKTHMDSNVYAAYALQLAADSLISRLYVNKIKGTIDNPRYMSVVSVCLTEEIISILENLCFYSDSDKDKPTTIHLENNINGYIKWQIPLYEKHYIMLFIAAVLHNSAKHGLAEGKNKKVYVKSNDYLKKSPVYGHFRKTAA